MSATSSPSGPGPRRFRLSDAIVLMAATAAALAAFKPYYATMTLLNWAQPYPFDTPFAGWIKSLWGCLILASPFAMAWTLAILALRLRRPRDRWSRLVRQPGLVAGLLAALVLAVRLLGFATMCVRLIGRQGLWVWTAKYAGGGGAWMGWPPGNLLFETDHFLDTMAMIGVSVASGWMPMCDLGAALEDSWGGRPAGSRSTWIIS